MGVSLIGLIAVVAIIVLAAIAYLFSRIVVVPSNLTGLISGSAFSALILMAVVMTALTMPTCLMFDRSGTQETSANQAPFAIYVYDEE